MSKGIVIQLQEEALDENGSIENLLRKAYLIAWKLKLLDFQTWIINEQNGYKAEVPEYRIVTGEINAWNPFYGWQKVIMQDKVADSLSTMRLGSPIASIVEAYNGSGETIGLSVSGEMTTLLNESSDSLPTKYCFITSKSELHKIISAVRNNILQWSLILEENNILGENLSFTDEEKAVAHESTMISNYVNNFYSISDNTTIKQGDAFGK